MSPSAETRTPVQDVLVFYDKPEEFLDPIVARFPAQRFHLCRRYGDLAAAIAEARPQVAFACKFEPKPFAHMSWVVLLKLKIVEFGRSLASKALLQSQLLREPWQKGSQCAPV